jgi:hypothetical protein
MPASRHPSHCRLLLLVVLLGAALAALPRPSRADPPASPFGVNSHIATRSGSLAAMPWAADVVAGSGAGWAREDFHWYWIEPAPGQFHWESFDRMVDLLAARGVNIIGVLGHPPGWATWEPGDDPSGLSFRAPDPQAFANYAAAVVTRYRGRIVHWEIWNEPDNALFWQPQPDPLLYARLLSAVAPAIRVAAPEDHILIGGLNPWDTTFLRTIAEVGAWWAFDIIAIHPYVDPLPPEANGEIGAALSNIRQITAWAGEKPIWVTEYGWDALPNQQNPAGMSEDDQANDLVRGALLLQSAGAERVLWYGLKDEAHNGFGLLRFAGGYGDLSQPRPAFGAFLTLNRQLAGAAFVRRVDALAVLAGGGVYALHYQAGDATVDVLWATTPSDVLLPAAGAGATVVGRDGAAWTVPAEHGWLHLFPGPSPIYVRHAGG